MSLIATSDEFRGRVFAVYDVVVNGSIVSFAIIAAMILPQSGDSWLVPTLVAITYLLIAAVVLRPAKFFLKDDGATLNRLGDVSAND